MSMLLCSGHKTRHYLPAGVCMPLLSPFSLLKQKPMLYLGPDHMPCLP